MAILPVLMPLLFIDQPYQYIYKRTLWLHPGISFLQMITMILHLHRVSLETEVRKKKLRPTLLYSLGNSFAVSLRSIMLKINIDIPQTGFVKNLHFLFLVRADMVYLTGYQQELVKFFGICVKLRSLPVILMLTLLIVVHFSKHS